MLAKCFVLYFVFVFHIPKDLSVFIQLCGHVPLSISVELKHSV